MNKLISTLAVVAFVTTGILSPAVAGSGSSSHTPWVITTPTGSSDGNSAEKVLGFALLMGLAFYFLGQGGGEASSSKGSSGTSAAPDADLGKGDVIMKF